jgi:AcrR family transcriptional regulator
MPVAGRTKKDVLAEFRHAEILEAARQVFARRGFADASMEEISHVAGLAKGTLYLYYRSKRDLYHAALRGGLLALGDTLEHKIEAASSLRARIHAYVATKVAYFEENRDFFRIYFAEFGNPVSGPTQREFKEHCRRQVDLLVRAIRASGRAGAPPRVEALEAAHAIFDLTRGVITRRLLGWTSSPMEDDVTFVVKFATRALERA